MASSGYTFESVLSMIMAALGDEATSGFDDPQSNRIRGLATKLRLRNPWNSYLVLHYGDMAKKSELPARYYPTS